MDPIKQIQFFLLNLITTLQKKNFQTFFLNPDPGPQLCPGRLPYPVDRVACIILYGNLEISAHVLSEYSVI